MTMMHTLPKSVFTCLLQYGLPMALFALLAAACLFADEPAQSPASPPTPATRVALVPSGNCSGASLDAMSVAEAQLASSTQIKLLDRQTIDKTLQEHEITLGGLVDTDLAIKTGKILTTDLLAVLEGSAGGDGKPQGIVVFDVKTGVRLCDETLMAATPDRWAGDIAAVVEVAVEKYRAPPQAVVTLSIVGVRNVDMSAERDAFCEAIGRLVERELIRSSGIAILERQHLTQVLRERAISPEAPENALLASMQSIHLEITQSKPSGIGVAAILTDPAGQTHRVAAVDENGTVTAAVTNLSAEILETLNAKPPQGQPNRQADAERMVTEAAADNVSYRFDHAVVCAEAALALYPEDRDMPFEAAFHIFHQARYLLQPKTMRPGQYTYEANTVPPENIEPAAASLLRYVDLMSQQYEYEAAHNGIGAYKPLLANQWYEAVPMLLRMLARAPGERTERARKLNGLLVQRYQRLMLDVFIPAWPEAWQKEFTIEKVRPQVMAIHSSQICLLTSKAQADLAIEHAGQVMQLLNHRSLGLARDECHAVSYVYLLTPLTFHSHEAIWNLTADDYCRLHDMFNQMTRHRLPGMRIFGMSGLLWVDQTTDGLTPEQVRDRAQAILAFAKPMMNDPGVDDAERVACYEALLNVINTAALAEADRFKMIDDIFCFMLSRKEAVEGVVEMAAFPKRGAYENYYSSIYPGIYLTVPVDWMQWHIERHKHDIPQAFRAVAQLQSLIASPEACFPDGCAKEIRSRTKLAMEYYARIDPTLVPTSLLSAVPWTKARKLIAAVNQDEFLSQPVVQGNHVYVVSLRRLDNESRNARLLRISPNSGEIEQIGQLDLARTSPEQDNNEGYCRHRGYPLRSPQISGGNLYCATPVQGGIVGFSLDGSAPTHISEKIVKGMPTNVFDQIVVVGNKIFAMTCGVPSYIHWYDPDGEGWQVVASSERVQRQTPADQRLKVGAVVHDPYHDRILFTLCPIISYDNWHDSQHGLYQFDIHTRAISKVTDFDAWPYWTSPQGGERLLCAFAERDNKRSIGGIYELDMRTDRWREICRSAGTKQDFIANAERVAQQVCTSPGFMPPFTMIDGWLWSFDPLGRISPDGAVVEKFPDILENKQEPYPVATDFNVLTYLPERRAILYGDKRSLWYLELPQQPDPPPAATPAQQSTKEPQ